MRGVTTPYPGAFSYLGDKKYLIWDVSEVKTPAKAKSVKPGTILSVSPLTVACGSGAVRVNFAQAVNGLYSSGEQLVNENRIVEKMRFVSDLSSLRPKRKKSILILGVNGFIGSAISERLLASGEYEIYGMGPALQLHHRAPETTRTSISRKGISPFIANGSNTM